MQPSFVACCAAEGILDCTINTGPISKSVVSTQQHGKTWSIGYTFLKLSGKANRKTQHHDLTRWQKCMFYDQEWLTAPGWGGQTVNNVYRHQPVFVWGYRDTAYCGTVEQDTFALPANMFFCRNTRDVMLCWSYLSTNHMLNAWELN